jgi:hypothetical protein
MTSLLLPLLILGTALAVVGVKVHQQQPPTRIVNAPVRLQETSADSPTPSHPTTLPQPPDAPHPGYQTPWEALNQEDFQGFVRALRAGGCPEITVRDFAVAALGRRHQQRVEAPRRLKTQQSTWWKDAWSWQDERLSVAMHREREALDRELLNLLGVSGAELREIIGWQTASPASDWLDLAKREQLAQWQQRQAAELKELESRALPGAPGPLITEDLRAQLKNLRLQHREELGVLLGAEDFERYLVRESDEAGYVLHHLPQAQSEEEFRLWVQAAIDVGVEQADIQADRLSALLPTSASNSTAPSLRDRVLNRFRELSDNAERFQELEAEMAAEQKRKEEERARQREQRELERLQQIATLAGTSITLEEARQFTEALESHAEFLEQRWGPPPERQNEAERTAWETQIKAEFEKVAVSVLGDRGRAITQEMIRQENRSP